MQPVFIELHEWGVSPAQSMWFNLAHIETIGSSRTGDHALTFMSRGHMSTRESQAEVLEIIKKALQSEGWLVGGGGVTNQPTNAETAEVPDPSTRCAVCGVQRDAHDSLTFIVPAAEAPEGSADG